MRRLLLIGLLVLVAFTATACPRRPPRWGAPEPSEVLPFDIQDTYEDCQEFIEITGGWQGGPGDVSRATGQYPNPTWVMEMTDGRGVLFHCEVEVDPELGVSVVGFWSD